MYSILVLGCVGNPHEVIVSTLLNIFLVLVVCFRLDNDRRCSFVLYISAKLGQKPAHFTPDVLV